jgi:hypothetical protein
MWGDGTPGRTIQSTVGLVVAVLIYGAALGGVFAVAYAFAQGRIGRLGARATALLVAAAGFVAVELVPFLKYPANPPAIGSADTIGRRAVRRAHRTQPAPHPETATGHRGVNRPTTASTGLLPAPASQVTAVIYRAGRGKVATLPGIVDRRRVYRLTWSTASTRPF